MKNNIGEFLHKNNAIFSYLKDSNGNRMGVIIAVPGNDPLREEPRIGCAFFNEVVEDSSKYRIRGTTLFKYEEPLKTIADAPRMVEELSKILGASKASLFNKIDLPFTSERSSWGDEANLPCKISSRFIKKLDELKLARKRVNFFRECFYENEEEFDRSSRYSTEANLHHQIRKFEYRALRYFKYIPGHRN